MQHNHISVRFFLSFVLLFLTVIGYASAQEDRWALVGPDGRIVNVIVWEDGSSWKPPEGMTLVPDSGDAQIGGLWRDGKFSPAEVRKVPPRELSRLESILVEKGILLEEDLRR